MTEITAEDDREYTQGACWVLANVISEMTGWPRYRVTPDPLHVWVGTPGGHAVDVRGYHPEHMDEFAAEWYDRSDSESYDIVDEDDDLSQWSFFSGWHPRYWDRAREIAPILIADAIKQEHQSQYAFAA
jgi:hypothetical protein